jgi:FkbM family methyltransferase
MFYPSLDRWLYLTLHEWRLMGVLERKVIERFVSPGMHVVDVGANIGLYSILFSQRVGQSGKVTALEPVPEIRMSLEMSLEKNCIKNVTVLPFAAGATESSLPLALDPLNSGNNWAAMPGTETNLSQISVPVRRLDTLGLSPTPDFVKIDVQGWEVQVLQGMSGLMEQKQRPIIFCEICEQALRMARSSTESLAQTLLDYGYEIYLPRKEGTKLNLRPVTMACLREQASKRHYFDIIAMASKP